MYYKYIVKINNISGEFKLYLVENYFILIKDKMNFN